VDPHAALDTRLDGSIGRSFNSGGERMTAVRYLVESVDEALPFYRALGFRLTDRWGPPFAIVKRKGLAPWLSGPGTSARKKLSNGSTPVPGGRQILVEDPSGNPIELIEPQAA
jgi:catechol 2,3-dioxygenase-like lactoylglutathione lyase family enzyme